MKKIIPNFLHLTLILMGCQSNVPKFDEDHAFEYLVAQCDFGPRNPGSDGYYACLDYMIAELDQYADEIILQDFSYQERRYNNRYELENIIARFNPDAEFQTVISAHWDTRPWADQEDSRRDRDQPIIGANDGASGVAILLELAKIMGENPPPIGVNLVFFDGEDLGVPGENSTYCQGSRYFAKNLPIPRPDEAINLDMVGRMNPDTKSLTVGGTGTGVGLSDFLKTNSQNSDLNLIFSSEGYGPSDHSSFYVEDIPVLFFFSGSHQDYHTPEDDSDKINYAGLKNISEIVYNVVFDVANRSDNFVFQEAGTKEQSGGRRRFKVTLGILPDYTYHESPGLRVDGVLDGRPAKKAGMKKGDIITAIDDEIVGDIYDYMYRLEKLDIGETVSVEVRRDGKKIILSVSF